MRYAGVYARGEAAEDGARSEDVSPGGPLPGMGSSEDVGLADGTRARGGAFDGRPVPHS